MTSTTLGIDTWSEVEKNALGFEGKLYPSDMLIEARAAEFLDIRKWQNIDNTNPISVAKHIKDIVLSCIRVSSISGQNDYNVRDIYEHDKLALLLTIFGKTFDNKKEHNLFVKGRCFQSDCLKTYDKLIVQRSNIKYQIPAEKYHKYIDSERGCFVIQTKSHGEIIYKPSTIGLGEIVSAWTTDMTSEFVQNNMDILQTVQALALDWRTASAKELRRLQIEEYNLMSENKKLFYLALIDECSIKPEDELEFECSACGAPFRSVLPLSIFDKRLFYPVQSFDNELL